MSQRQPGHNLLVTLCCPVCNRRVAVMPYFPLKTKTIRPKDITYVYDGKSPDTPEKLVCRKCWAVFPARAASIPKYLEAAARGELQREIDQLRKTEDSLSETS